MLIQKSGWFVAAVLVMLVPSGSSEAQILRGREVPLASSTGSQPAECGVKSINKIATGTRPDWSPEGRLIGYDAPVDGSNELFLVSPDGANQRCITCQSLPKELRGRHKGKLTFHPDGRHILFGAENDHGKHGLMNTPGIGDNFDLWMTDLDGKTFWRLTRTAKGSALQYPRFSADGRRLVWSERYEKGRPMKKGQEYGLWKIHIADVAFGSDGPKLANIVDLEPGGKGFYEPHGFSPDGSRLIFTAVTRPGKPQVYGEIFTFDLATRRLVNLAESDDLHFEQALYSPSGRRISFMSGPFIGALRMGYRTDLYVMDADGRNRVRLTYFNEPGRPEYTGGDALVDKNSWNPDGTQIALGRYVRKGQEQAVLVLTFQGPCGK